MAPLAPAELIKSEDRISLFLQRYVGGTSFLLRSGETVRLVRDPMVELAVATKNSTVMRSLRLLGQNGEEYRFSDLEKTRDFGGEGGMRGISEEEQQVLNINTQIRSLSGGKGVVIDIGGIPSTIKMLVRNRNRYEKADLLFLDPENHPKFFLSYKNGGGKARHWQQYGGISEKHEPEQYHHPEINDFAQEVYARVGAEGIQNGQFFRRRIIDPAIQMRALYGRRFGDDFGPNNVHGLISGRLSLVPLRSFTGRQVYYIRADAKYLNGEGIVGELEPVLSARRGERNDLGIKTARFGVFPFDHKQGAISI